MAKKILLGIVVLLGAVILKIMIFPSSSWGGDIFFGAASFFALTIFGIAVSVSSVGGLLKQKGIVSAAQPNPKGQVVQGVVAVLIIIACVSYYLVSTR